MREIEDILVDYFAGEELSPEESRVLAEWLEQETNMRLTSTLQGMRKGIGIRKRLHREPERGMRSIWHKVNARSGRRRLFYRYSAVACLLLSLGMAWLYWGTSDMRPEAEQVVTTKSIDGKSFARLKLANGEVISLHANRDEVIVADSFMKVENTNNTLVYNKHTIKKEVEFNTLTVPLGAEYNVILADGTKVYLNAGSELRFPVVFSGNTREVYLEGEGYFEVAKDSVKRFEVHASGMTAVVLGTSFNVKAYADQEHVATTLEEGHLKIVCGDREEYDLLPGNQVCYDRGTGESAMKKVDTKYYTSWKDGYYSFNEMPLEEVLEMLSKWYDLKVFYVDEEVKEYEFSGRLKRYDDFGYLLSKFEETGVVEFIIKDNVITVRKK